MKIHEIRRKRRSVSITYTKGNAKFALEEPDMPLPSFGKAFDALLPIVAAVLHLPAEWLGNTRVVGLRFGEQSGAQTAALIVRKGLDDAAKEFAFITPERLLANPNEPGTYTPPLERAHAELIEAAEEEGKKYVRGERAQGEIQFEGASEKEDDGADLLSPAVGEPPAPEKPKGKRKPRKEGGAT